MGKQSRKKFSKKGSKEYKAKLKERREKQDQRIDNDSTNYSGEFEEARNSALTILEGDRVWILSVTKTECKNQEGSDDPELRRGVVKKLGRDGTAEVQTLASVRDGDQCTRKIPIKDLWRDFENLIPEFQVGDEVICSTDSGALPGLVTYLWPVWQHKRCPERGLIYVPFYEVTIYPSMAGRFGSQPFTVVSFSEKEDSIMAQPTVFRFSSGDHVLINWKKADFPSMNERARNIRFGNDEWIRATISDVDTFGQFGYAAYECTIEGATKSKRLICYVLKEQAEFIAPAIQDPRERLFAAIEQDCSFEHIDYLITTYSIDVSLIQELVTSKVIENGNFGMFRWLEEKQGANLASLSFPGGNNILHEICRSPNAYRFLRQYAQNSFKEKKIMYRPSLDKNEHRYIMDSNNRRVPDQPRINQRNEHGETWLHVLIKKGDLHAIDCALSLLKGLFWILRPCDFTDLKSSRFESNSVQGKIIEFAIDIFLSEMKIFRQVDLLYFLHDESEDRMLQGTIMQDFCAKKFIRFVRQWNQHHPDFETYRLVTIVCQLSTKGFSKMFRALIDADDTVLNMRIPSLQRKNLDKLFVQPELYNDLLEENEVDDIDLTVAEVVAEGHVRYKPYGSVEDYISFLLRLGSHLSLNETSRSGFSILSWLEVGFKQHQIEKIIYDFQRNMLEDDISLPGRIEILTHLVNRHGVECPNVLRVVKTHQRGVLSWMLQQSLVKLDSKASLDEQFSASNATKLELLGAQRIPANISCGSLLAFSCVEYGSLHVLSWLSEDQHVALDCSINGFTFLHTCAYFGRLEIIIWFYTRPEWNEIARAFSTRKGFEGATAVHVAVKRGHINAADLLLQLRCPSVDKRSTSHRSLALKSTHEFVRKWGARQAEPVKNERSRLNEDVHNLLELVSEKSYDAAKKCLTSTKCMDIGRWKRAGVRNASEETLFGGETYESVLLQCMNGHDEDFGYWFCESIVSIWAGEHSFYNNLEIFWHSDIVNGVLDLSFILDTVGRSGDENLIKLFSDPSMHDIKIRDPCAWLPKASPAFVKQHLVLRQIYTAMLRTLPRKAEMEIRKGGDPQLLKSMATSYRRAARKVAGGNEERFGTYFKADDLFTSTGERYINMNFSMETSALRGYSQMMLSVFGIHDEFKMLHLFIAIENYSNFLDFCIKHGECWTASKELEMIRIGAYFGHDQIVAYFLDGKEFLSSYTDLQGSAILGFAGSGRGREWKRMVDNHGLPSDQPPFELMHEKGKGGKRDYDKERKLLFSSHSVTIIHGFLSTSEESVRMGHRAMIKFLFDSDKYNPIYLLEVIHLVFELTFDTSIENLSSLLNLMFTKTGTSDPMGDRVVQDIITRITTNELFKVGWTRKSENYIQALKQWLNALGTWGINIQSLEFKTYDGKPETESLFLLLLKLQEEQRSKWTELDVIKKGQKLSEIEAAVQNENISFEQRDQNGLSLIHLASSYDRVDVLEWLVDSGKVDIRQKDSQGRTPLNIAKASKAANALKWIEERQAMTTLSNFFRKNLRRRLASIRQSRITVAASKIQALQRATVARKSFRGMLLLRVEESLRFNDVWEGNIKTMDRDVESSSWSSTRNRHENRVSHLDDLEAIVKTSEKLDAASTSAIGDEYADEFSDMDRLDEMIESTPMKSSNSHMGAQCEITIETKIMFTEYVMKWLRHADEKYREFFVRRLKQLQRGDRSRILAKKLKGSISTIFETYLEQKSGHRILWRNEGNGTILIWFVARHKNVSRLMQLIDDSESRSARQRISSMDALPETAVPNTDRKYDHKHRVLLNPLGNVPLKVYEIESLSLEEVKGDAWSPQLYLSEQERDIIECNGSVLLLGRSGTGKTICICNRMDLDARRFQHNTGFSQLFVARSQRLCRYVAETVGLQAQENTFTTFRRLIENLENMIPQLMPTGGDVFLTSRKMDFARFKRDVYSGTSKKSGLQIDPLLVWTNIRTFCKGSIEALQSPNQILGKDAFLGLGDRRCRLGKTHRDFVYDIFLCYQNICCEQNLWDDCDRITSLVGRLQEAREKKDPSFDKIHQSKIYVDEIQDYTQAEVCLFFLLSGSGDLFMAGDPAQSVVEGVEFRFEDIRSVAYHLSTPGNRDLIPQKPKVVTINFRSHSGVMDTAAAILRFVFDAFPYSAKQLAEDRGLFTGPRPGVFHPVQVDRLRTLISEKLNGIVILTHDSSVRYWKKALGNYELVYGIRAAKGLEFKSVIILDFFSELPRELQKPWRNLLLGRTGENPKPELEGQLKLLYTAVTRCVEQLFFAETSRSSSGDAFVRWVTTTSIRPKALATRQSVDNVEIMSLTQDEWVASGLDNAELAESTEEMNLEQSLSLMDKALFCFEQGKDQKLSQRARTHRAALLFRRDLLMWEADDGMKPDGGTVEVRVAELMGRLLSDDLRLEALRIVKFALPYFGDYSKERLEGIVLPKLHVLEQDNM